MKTTKTNTKNPNNKNTSYKGLSRSQLVYSRCESLERFGYFLKCHQNSTDWTTPERFNEITKSELPEEMRNNQNLILQFVNFYCDILFFGEYMKRNTQEPNVISVRCSEMREQILKYGFDELTLEGFEKAINEVANSRFRTYDSETREKQRKEKEAKVQELKDLKAEVKLLKQMNKDQAKELEELDRLRFEEKKRRQLEMLKRWGVEN